MRRPPLTLWFAVLVELWRLILLTTAILVVVLAFAAAVRFLADGRLGPTETIRLMFLAMPPMLQYALPFAAGFGATLAYHRAATDNELTASFAAGVSHRALLVPAIASGLVLAGTVLALSNEIIPRFLRSMEQLVTRDAARIIVASIERKEAVKMDNTLLYADLVRRNPSLAGSDADRLYLKGVIAVELDKKGEVKYLVSAREADVWLVRAAAQSTPGVKPDSETVTHVFIRSRGTVGQKAGEGLMEGETLDLSRTIPNAFSDDPKFLTWGELGDLREDPSHINFINSRRRVLAARLAERATTSAVADALATRGLIRFDAGEGAWVEVHAGAIRWDKAGGQWVVAKQPAAGDKSNDKPEPLLVLRQFETGRVTRQLADSVTFRTAVDPDAPEREVTISLTLEGLASAQGTPGARAGALKPQTIAQLGVPDADLAGLMDARADRLIALADERLATDPTDDYVQSARDDLRKRIADLMREISSKQHERFASAAACLVMIVTGAVMAVRLRSKLPLEVYLWAFFPALATVMTISAGQQLIHSQGLLGVPVMWGGVIGLGLYTLLQFRRVARN
jgi:lipopolysaccharide export LptBFGC system permease protein LptF